MAKKFIDDLPVGSIIKVDGRYLLCKEKNASSVIATCNGCYYFRYDKCMKPLDASIDCASFNRQDGKTVIFQEIHENKGLLLVKDIEVLERLSKEYPGKTLENIQMQLQARFKELNK